jgi:hypothetical protein
MNTNDTKKPGLNYAGGPDDPGPSGLAVPPEVVSRRPRMSLGGMGAGGRGELMSVIPALVVGFAIGALVFGWSGSGAAVSIFGGGGALLFLLPCLIMGGMMLMMMMRKGDSPSDQKTRDDEDRRR